MEGALSTLKDAETGQRGYLLTNDTSYLRPYTGAHARALAIVDYIRDLTLDNAAQQRSVAELHDVIANRLSILQQVIDQKKADNIYSLADLKKGQVSMDEAREIIQRMITEERRLMVIRVGKLQKFSNYTPILILIAAFLSIVITLVFYRRVVKDYGERSALYGELKQKDEETARRIAIIGGIADEISKGNYHTRVSDEQQDSLGSPVRFFEQDGGLPGLFFQPAVG